MSRCGYPHVVVTGASSGIGRAVALRLAASGYHVYAGVRAYADGITQAFVPLLRQAQARILAGNHRHMPAGPA